MYLFIVTSSISICVWTSFVAVSLSTNDLGYSYKLSETIETTNENSSACYGIHTKFNPSCAQRPGTVIGIQALNVGAKPSVLGCPAEVSNTYVWNSKCCSPNISDDCIQRYDYTHSEIDYKFHKHCSGYAECKEALQVVRAISKCPNSIPNEFMPSTNYIFMEYACIEETRIGRLCSNETYQVNETGVPFYLQSPGYPSSNNTANVSACTCHVEANSTINIYILDLRLYGQTLKISDSYSSDIYTTANATIFNVTTINKSDESWITLENFSYQDESYVWIGFEATNFVPFSIMCTLVEAGVTGSTPAEAGATGSTMVESGVTASTLVESGVTASNNATMVSPTTVKCPCNECVVAGTVTGSLIALGILLLLCYLYKRKHCKSDDQQKITEEHPNLQKAPENFMNETFKPSKIPSNKVEPTRYIEEHGGLGATSLPNIFKTVKTQNNDLELETSTAQTKHLQTLNMSVLMDNNGDKQENIPNEHRKERKKRKHKKHKLKGNFATDLETNPEQTNHATNDENLNQGSDERKHARRTKKKNRNSVLPISDKDYIVDEATTNECTDPTMGFKIR